MNCDTCAYYVYDEDYDDYICTMDMDEDDYSRLLSGTDRGCRFYRNGDEYLVVRKQM